LPGVVFVVPEAEPSYDFVTPVGMALAARPWKVGDPVLLEGGLRRAGGAEDGE